MKKGYCIGVDLGGTNIAVGLVDLESREIVKQHSVKTNAPRPCEEICGDINEVCKKLVSMQGITMDEICEKFGKRVMELVSSETENKRDDLPPEDTWFIRKEESLEKLKNTEDIEILMLWLGDKLSNIRAIYRDYLLEGDAVWQKFHQSDINVQAWYYRSIMKYTERLSNTLAWREYKTLVKLLFGAEESK